MPRKRHAGDRAQMVPESGSAAGRRSIRYRAGHSRQAEPDQPKKLLKFNQLPIG
jgi:hypothetical protein